MHNHADHILEACKLPFWGRAETKSQKLGHAFRHTELDVEGQPKSVFQIGGAGAVGTGSLRGMRHLAELAAADFADQNPVLIERAAGSEDAFDAVTSALSMSQHVGELENLQSFPAGSPQLIEGCIWSSEMGLGSSLYITDHQEKIRPEKAERRQQLCPSSRRQPTRHPSPVRAVRASARGARS
jgi:hypothetical protein